MKAHWLLLGAVIAAAATACTTDNVSPTTTATATTSIRPPSTAPTSASPSTTTPPLTRTVDIGPYQSGACALLTREQLDALDLGPKGDGGQNGCHWEGQQPRTVIKLILNLRDLYLSDSKYAKEIEWMTIGGQPATTIPSSPYGCTATVATAPAQGFLVIASTADTDVTGDDWCARAVAAAEQIVANLVK